MIRIILTNLMYDWRIYNERLVRRGEILISRVVIKSWNKELVVMNHNKRGRRFPYQDSYEDVKVQPGVFLGCHTGRQRTSSGHTTTYLWHRITPC
jgi:hypothetical protein